MEIRIRATFERGMAYRHRMKRVAPLYFSLAHRFACANNLVAVNTSLQNLIQNSPSHGRSVPEQSGCSSGRPSEG
jgi:hypothetical protein